MFKKSITKVFCLSPLFLGLTSCVVPATAPNACAWNNGGFPSSTTETHTKTTIVTPPSYATVNMPPPSIMQAAPTVQQPMMMQSSPCAPMQASPCQSYQASNPCAPVQAYDPCNYNVSVPQQPSARYTIAIPPAPAPQYTIALPQGNPPQYAVVQQQQPVSASVPVKLQSASQDHCVGE
jgi:hypothetical protein